MKIIIFSDSHYKSIFKLDLTEYDYVIHCGDILPNDIDYINLEDNIYSVSGNCDYKKEMPIEREFIINNKKFFICHGHTYNVKETYSKLIEKGQNYDFVMFGHTHIPYVNKVNNTFYINPGSFLEGSYMVLEDNILNMYQKPNLFSKKDKYKLVKTYYLNKL